MAGGGLRKPTNDVRCFAKYRTRHLLEINEDNFLANLILRLNPVFTKRAL
jgi:hypothetical protein